MNFIKIAPLTAILLTALLSMTQSVLLMAQEQTYLRFEQHHDEVLGTSMDLTIYGTDQVVMETAANAALAEIARLENIFSTYREDSELMRLNQTRVTENASPELLEVLSNCAQWQRYSQGRFSCNLGKVVAAWDAAEEAQVTPDRDAMRILAQSIAQEEVLVEGRRITLPGPVDLDPSGLAKGYIIDQAMAVLREELRQARAIKLDIGGDGIYWGRPPLTAGWRVAIANPMTPSDNRGFLATLSLENMAIAASGHTSRFRTIEGRRFSHIFDPEGWPVENGIGAIVLSPTAMAADAVATAMTMQTLTDAANWASGLPELDAIVVDAEGNQEVSDIWPSFVAEEISSEEESVLRLDYTLPAFRGSYYRPYVAIWISDPEQNPRKNLLLLGESERWARENTRWWRRVGRSNPALLDGIARPTRAPGEYRMTWDGRDDSGNLLPSGEYILHLEAARENSGTSYQRIPFSLGGGEQSVQIAPDGELGRIELIIMNPE